MAGVDLDFGLPSPDDLLDQGQDLAESALGFAEPREQVIASAIIFGAALVSSTVSLGATLVIAFIALILFCIGLVRLSLAWIRS